MTYKHKAVLTITVHTDGENMADMVGDIAEAVHRITSDEGKVTPTMAVYEVTKIK